MRILQTTDNRKVYGVNVNPDNSVRWEQKNGTPYIIFCIFNGNPPDLDELTNILIREEKKIIPNSTCYCNEGSIIITKINPMITSRKIDKTGVVVGAFAAEYIDDELCVYALGADGNLIRNNFTIIKTKVHIECIEESYEEKKGFLGWLRGNGNIIHSYKVTVTATGLYNDGDVFYSIGGFNYPIPASTVQLSKPFYIPCKNFGNDKLKFGTQFSNIINLSVPHNFKD